MFDERLEQVEEDGRIEAAWSYHRKWFTAYVLTLLGYVPVMAMTIFVCDKIVRGPSPVGLALFAVYAGTWVYLGICVQQFECPRCREAFHRRGWIYNIFSRKCLHCGLRLYAKTLDP